MNDKKLYREYAIYKGITDCVSFVKVEDDYYNSILHYKDRQGIECTWDFMHKDMVIWIIKVSSNKVFDHMLLSSSKD